MVAAAPVLQDFHPGGSFNKHDGRRPGVGPFCNGQITWEDGPSSGRTVHRAY